jgi:hypothetical protein
MIFPATTIRDSDNMIPLNILISFLTINNSRNICKIFPTPAIRALDNTVASYYTNWAIPAPTINKSYP